MSTAALTVYNCVYVPPANARQRLDGDTFRCQGNVEPVIPDSQLWVPKVRLVKIDAPESGQPGAEDARTALIGWLERGPFNLICFARDKYGRLLADAEYGQGLVSDFMLKQELVVPMGVKSARNLVPDADPQLLRAIVHPSKIQEVQ